ncbi:hypothetical protein N7539_009006 [Penicillium diatomitis]|uniref:Nucleoside phosphorylase domain-containing protein n=1 Tax=Penicillium diatomitis TaxID=2819901 RepID=A0A9X0BJH5_9EURO|nr:uncharacterized protein N7539_009006 [Penicillium diatomitis]KAJ5469388.1 hypothetical protein N7539_009006 [Penicillium diatomitis]
MHHSLPHALSDARESEDETKRYSTPSATRHGFSHSSPSLKLHHEAYTIAWICALHIEMAAAMAVLDELHGPLHIDPDDSNTYQLGHIGQHNVVIACLPAQGYGTVNAALVVTNLKRSFPFAHTGLMIGIGGGVPNMGDIRLGDVVVGTRVMQHDFGKFIGDGRMITTAVPRLPPLRLLTAVSALRAEHELLPSRIPQILQNKFAGKPAFARPTAPDRLFRADYEHGGSHINCNECDWSNLVPRWERSSSDIRIHYGGIASGNQVIKNGMIRDAIAKAHDIVCFEMEAAGIVDSLPCLIVRGICDYADSHKNKEWQRFAASAAAAYARALIGQLPVSRPRMSLSSGIEINDIKHKERRQGLLESLQFSQMDARRVTIENAHASTCAWFFDHPKFHEWLDPQMIAHHHGLLWLSGKPGAGKSTIMKFTYLELKKATSRENSLIASFFFNARGDTLEKTVQGMFRSLLLQLLERYPYLQVVLDDPDIIPRGQKTCPCLNTLKDLLSKAILTLGSKGFTCFVDALDECDEQQAVDMVQYFEDVAERSSSQGVPFKICFSSRHYPHIAVKRAIRLTLEDEQGHFQDLNLYITNRLKIDESHILEKVGSLLIKKAAGVFMWVVLVVEMLNRDYRRGGIVLHQKLKKLPSDISELFRDILRRDGDDVEDLRLGLLWILFAKRPLQLQEFRHAVWSGLSPEELSDEDQDFTSDTHSIESMNRFVIASTKGLAEITKGSKPIVQFIHESVRDFLMKDQGLNQLWPEIGPNPEISSHQVLRDSCQKYLSLVFARMPNNCANSPRSERKKLLQRYPFSVYACSYILRHSDSAATSHSQDGFLQGFNIDHWVKLNNFLEEPSLRKYHSGSLEYVLADLGCPNLTRVWLSKHPTIHQMFPTESFKYSLFAALANGNKETVASLLGISSHIYHGTDITDGVNPRRISETSRGLTPLIWAMKWCHFQLARLLLLQGVDPNDSRRRTSPALDIALRKRNHDVAKLLLECGANMNYGPDENPLFLACTGGFDDVVSLLLDHGVSVELQNSSFETPLYCASKNGHLHTVTLLIKRGATINHSSSRSLYSSLLAAAEQGKPEVARFLIRNGADVNACDRSGFSPLTKSAQRGHLSIVQLLLEAGAEVNSVDNHGLWPLIVSCEQGHISMIWLLLKNGADTDALYYGKVSPLAKACQRGHMSVVQTLLETGATANILDPNSRSPLVIACERGHQPIVNLLLDYGADINSTDGTYFSPLTQACERGNNAIANLLLERGADVNAHDRSGFSPLLKACKKGQTSIAQLFLRYGAKANGTDEDGYSPLILACERGHQSTVKLLLEFGANLDAINYRGHSPLTKACEYGHLPVVHLLLDNGADVNAFDGSGSSPLIEACAHGHTQVVRFLLRMGANVDVFDQSGFSPLTRACERGYLSLVLTLLESGIDVTKPDRTGQAAITTTKDTNIILLLLGHGADIHVRDLSGNPILTRASQNNNWILATRLIKLGADVNAENMDGRTALLETTDARIASLLIDHGADVNACDRFGNTAVFRSVCEGNQALLSILLVKGADVNRVNLMGRTALTEALSTRGSIPQAHISNAPLSKPFNDDILRMLIRGGADINTCDVQGNTILSHVVTNYDCTLAQFLLEKGADVTITDRDGQTVLFKVRDATMAQLLLERGADVNARDALHQTPLLVSIIKRGDEVAKTLIDHEADVNAQSKYGLTPLMLLACRVAGILPETLDVLRPRHWLKYSFEDMPMLFSVSDARANGTLNSFVDFSWERELARLLVSRGANVNISTRFSETPLLMAMTGRMDYDFVLFLIEHGADVNVRTPYWLTPLQQARKKGRSVIVDLLLRQGASEVENVDV